MDITVGTTTPAGGVRIASIQNFNSDSIFVVHISPINMA